MSNSDEMQDVFEQLGALAPGEGEAPRPPGQMLARIKTRLPAKEQAPISWRIQQMFNRKFAIGFMAVLLIAATLAFPSVRAAASDFLGFFRVQKFAAISVSPQQLAVLQRIGDEGLYPGELEMISEQGPTQELGSLPEATLLAGFRIRTRAASDAPASIRLTPGSQGRLTVRLEAARSILRAADVDPNLLPDSLDGAQVDATIYPVVEQQWSDGVVLVQTQSPLVDYPDDVDTAVLGSALLQFLGMPADEAQRLAQSIDWTNTLILPVPTELATFSEVRVDGVSGLALTSLEGYGSSLMWEKDGIVYMLMSDTQDVNTLRDIANSLN